VNNEVLKPLGGHELLLLLLQLTLLLAVARMLGELSRRWNQPPVVGELLAGVALGPSLFGALLPGLRAAVFPHSQTQSDVLSAVAWLGVLCLLISTGLETDLPLIVRKGKTALLVSMGGITLPFCTGIALGWYLPDSMLTHPQERLVFCLFMATAMSITAIPVIAKVLMDLKLIRRDIGQITLAAGMTDDTVGWILLSVVAGLARSGTFEWGNLFTSLAGAAVFLGVAFTLGRHLVAFTLKQVDDAAGGSTANLSAVLVLSLAAACVTHSLGIEAALGAFVTGILVRQAPRFSSDTAHHLEAITTGFLAPIFFASAGLKVDVAALLVPSTFIVAMVVLGVACLGKFVGAYCGARLGRLSHWEAVALGSGMNARGAMEIIVATIGLSLGVLNQAMYSIVVLVAIATSLMAPPLLTWALGHVVMGDEEAQRMREEEHSATSFVKQLRRVLLPTRGGSNATLAAHLVGQLAQQQPLEVTALYATRSSSANGDAEAAIESVAKQVQLNGGLEKRVVTSESPTEAILREAGRGYNLIVLGATEQVEGTLFNSVVDQVVQEAPCATMVVKSRNPPLGGNGEVQRLRHILVPTVGTQYSRHAVEMASVIAAQQEALVTVVYVVVVPPLQDLHRHADQLLPLADVGEQIVDQQADLGRMLGANVNTQVLIGSDLVQEILELANRENVDLIVIGSHVRPITGRAFFGPGVDSILRHAACPVAVVSSS
jgi:Kef-type K+ transport system membrane component KefB